MPFLKQKYPSKKQNTTTHTMTPAIIPSSEFLGSVEEVLDDEATVKETKCKK
jgi:hypothetical protein